MEEQNQVPNQEKAVKKKTNKWILVLLVIVSIAIIFLLIRQTWPGLFYKNPNYIERTDEVKIDQNTPEAKACKKAGGELKWGEICSISDFKCNVKYNYEVNGNPWGVCKGKSQYYCDCGSSKCMLDEKCVDYQEYKNNQ